MISTIREIRLTLWNPASNCFIILAFPKREPGESARPLSPSRAHLRHTCHILHILLLSGRAQLIMWNRLETTFRPAILSPAMEGPVPGPNHSQHDCVIASSVWSRKLQNLQTCAWTFLNVIMQYIQYIQFWYHSRLLLWQVKIQPIFWSFHDHPSLSLTLKISV